MLMGFFCQWVAYCSITTINSLKGWDHQRTKTKTFPSVKTLHVSKKMTKNNVRSAIHSLCFSSILVLILYLSLVGFCLSIPYWNYGWMILISIKLESFTIKFVSFWMWTCEESKDLNGDDFREILFFSDDPFLVTGISFWDFDDQSEDRKSLLVETFLAKTFETL